MQVPTLFLMFGYPGSGKSTFARAVADSCSFDRVSYDELRGRMWPTANPYDTKNYQALIFGALDYAVEQLLTSGISVIYDVNNNRRSERAATTTLAKYCQARTVVVWVQTPLDVAQQREVTRALVENHHMVPEKYQRLVDSMEDPKDDEKVIRIDGLVSADEQLRAFDMQLEGVA